MVILFVVFLEPRGYLTKFHTGERGSALRSNPYPLNTLSYTFFFDRKVTFLYVLLTCAHSLLPWVYKWYPFRIPNLELCIFSMTLLNKFITKPERFCDYFTAIICALLAFLALYRSTWLIRLPFRTFVYLKQEKGTSFGRSLPVKAIIGSTPWGQLPVSCCG